MTDPSHYGFAKLVPGFDFLQNLAKGTTETLPQMPTLSNWVAPTLDIKELDKRIQELRAVHFWLEQNSKALGATIQALEVQKMTLATLKGMNCSMADLAQAMKLTPQPETTAAPAPQAAGGKAAESGAAEPSAAAGVIDPLQWWGSLTQQFQHIAASAMQEATQAAQAAQAAAQATSGRSRAGAARRAPAADTDASAPRKARKSTPRSKGPA